MLFLFFYLQGFMNIVDSALMEVVWTAFDFDPFAASVYRNLYAGASSLKKKDMRTLTPWPV